MISVPWHGNLKGTSYPHSIVRLDGHEIIFNSWRVNLNSTHVADDFTVEMPFRIAQDMGRQTYLNNTPNYASYLMTNPDVLVEIFVGYSGSAAMPSVGNLTRIMYGYMDDVKIDLSEAGEKVTITGRNMVAPFLDNKTTQKYQNMVSSAIADMLAKSHNLKTVITPTYTMAGVYYNGDSAQLSSDITEWDLLTYLAEQEGFELRVKDDTFYFGPFDQIVGNVTNDALAYTWGQNVMSLEIERQPHAAKNINVEVHSYDHAHNHHIKAKAVKVYSKATNTYTERYDYAGLTQDQAQKKAQSILDQLSRLEIMGTLDVTGNEKLTVDRKILLYGVGSGISDAYYVRKATHQYDNVGDGGYACNVTFSNLLLPDEQSGVL